MSALPIPDQDLSFLWLEITAKCNLQCRHCYAESGPSEPLFGELSTEDWLKILADASNLGCKQVQFIGGEPTLHPKLADLIAFAAAQGFLFIEVFTNATYITDALLSVFLKHHVHVAVSFYSNDPTTHDLITKRKGSFNHSINNIMRMINAKVPIRAAIIETPANLGHTLAARDLLEKFGVKDIKVDAQRKIGRGANEMRSTSPMQELCGECWKGKLCVTSSGTSYPCVFSRFVDLGNAKTSIKTIVRGEPLRLFRTALMNQQRPPVCGPTCSPCGPDTFRKACTPDVSCNPSFADCAPACAPSCNPSACGPNV
jgi:MoaA/NifB/PqqE/SkfB family radical SAM enzyme